MRGQAVFSQKKLLYLRNVRVMGNLGGVAYNWIIRKAPADDYQGGHNLDQRFLAALCRIIVGPTGRRLPAYGNVVVAFTEGLFKDYYTYNPVLSPKSYYKYLNTTAPFPRFLGKHYAAKSSDYRRTLSDMLELVDNCYSITLLWNIQDEVFRWATAYLPKDETAGVCKNYVSRNATRREVAVYLADVMNYALCRKNVGNRPTDMGVSL